MVIDQSQRLQWKSRRAGGLCLLEPLEDRRLLSGAGQTLPSAAVGSTFSGVLHLHYHAQAGVKAHSAESPMLLEIGAADDGAVVGAEAHVGTSGIFIGTSFRRSFEGRFAENQESIYASVNSSGKDVDGSLREVVNGQLVTGTFAVKDSSSASPKRKSDQAEANAATNGVAVYASGTSGVVDTVGFLEVPTTVSIGSGPLETISLPALDTALNNPTALNTDTTTAGISSAGVGTLPVMNVEPLVPGQEDTNLGSQSVDNGLTVGAPSGANASGINTGTTTTFTESSGIVTITQPVTSPTGGI